MKLEPIDTSTTAGKARVMQLAAEGRRVSVRLRDRDDAFGECKSQSWNWDAYIYAIIAQPVGPDEVWVTLSPDGEVIATHRSEPQWLQSDSRGRVATAVRYRRVEE